MDQVSFLRPITKLRLLQMYYHNCHNLISGPTFVADHGLLGGFYEQVEGHYDDLVEFMIATLGPKEFDAAAIADYIAKEMKQLNMNKASAEEMFAQGLEIELELYKDLEVLDKKGTIGLKNLIGDIAQAIDSRKYKIQQRLS